MSAPARINTGPTTRRAPSPLPSSLPPSLPLLFSPASSAPLRGTTSMVPHAWLLFSATIWLPCSWFAPVLEFFGFPDPCRSNENPAFPPTPTIPPEPTNVVHTPTTVDTRHSALFALVVVVLLSLTCPLFFFARRLGVPLRLVSVHRCSPHFLAFDSWLDRWPFVSSTQQNIAWLPLR